MVTSLQQSLAVGDVTRVQVTVSAPDMASRSAELVKTGGQWGGVLGQLPAGTDRTFSVQAFKTDGTAVYAGEATGVTITAGQTTVVSLTLQEINPPPPFDNSAPCITSLVATPATIEPGGVVTLQAAAKDVDPGDTLTFAWTARSGTFSSATNLSTTWTAPANTGPVTLTLTVTDSQGAAATVSLTIVVRAGRGSAAVNVSLNTWPQVSRVTASPTAVDVGSTTAVHASAADSDGDGLSYQWTASCAGTWQNATSANASFTPSSQPPGDTCANCALTVKVTDGRGGQTTGTLAICVGKKPTAQFPPDIVETFQSAITAAPGGTVTIRVKAEDPQNSALSFSWTASSGLLSAASHTVQTSHVMWTAPSCDPAGESPAITVTAMNALGLSVKHIFSVSSGKSCSDTWTPTGSMVVPRSAHAVEVLLSGKVLAGGGITDSVPVTSSEIYDPATGRWTASGGMKFPRAYYTLTALPSGKVLAVGGYDGNYNPVASVELYDPATGVWALTGSMASVRALHTASLLPSGKVLVVGGYNGAGAVKSAEVYDPTIGAWSQAGTMAFERYQHTATVLPSGQVLVVGGAGDSNLIGAAEMYDPAIGTWTRAGSLVSGRYLHTASLTSVGQLVVAGGSTTGTDASASTEIRDPVTGAWKSNSSMGSARFMHTASVLPTKILVIGGFDGSTVVSRTETYDFATGKWALGNSVTTPRYQHAATVLPSGRILITGGLNIDGASLRYTEFYTP
ncbi:kelch repeat-containing protein [Stigmatella sp. ncwal1]|uniref:Kelch repeat-containing protein n=1 Tax=Stigmatella ashevillensis TaxID=2995309 RepID=A0ABT5DJK7_9BACT|nr:kelch repeat-containing protein [Stigmatella ashevillena]MDC0713764.1 kelch repeat-containing protein [Stigmatella ashevillena]